MGILSLRMGLIMGGIFFFISVLLSGCGSQHEKKMQTAEQVKKWQVLADKSVSITPVPALQDYDDSVMEDISQPLKTDPSQPVKTDPSCLAIKSGGSRKLPTMKVTMKMYDISLPVLIRTLAKVANLDIMINDSVKGQSKIVITDVPWEQAFLGVLETFGLTYEWTGDILRVVSVDDLKRKQDLMEARQNYEKMKNKHDLTLMHQAQKKSRLEPLVTKIVKIHYADLTSLQKNLTQYLSNQEKEVSAGNFEASPQMLPEESEEQGLKGNVLIDKFTNSLILHASRSDIKKIMPIVRRLDQPIKQVLIEAHIVEAGSNTGKELGIQWGGLGTAATTSKESFSIGGNMTKFEQSLKDETGVNQPYQPVDGNIVNLPTTAATGMSLGVMAQKAGEYVLYAQLMALEEQGRINILSKPSITTLDHRMAVIESGKEVPFQTVEEGEVSIDWKKAVIKLEVTPHVIEDQIIRLEIVTHKDELDFANEVNGNPTIITKNAQTTVMLFDGQTTVIGGLNKEKSSGGEDGVPGLKNVPGLGWLFKSMGKAEEMEELLIFITPHILKEKTVKIQTQ
ncbi:type IV pilus secretin PilQ [Desulfobacula toluolica]|uniref:Type II and III secretion system protein n=1 Tax=Desulfobacula toluolica (strain DSM 7467 / Tol2) TaxID=651182 RepID=K0ND83_DESTT|nr:type IV pilus secretin PilQ [Desulfobacula toluolica]CCK78871.1 type II and III secretion system protein [Desulfobacula toluolica Tol2]